MNDEKSNNSRNSKFIQNNQIYQNNQNLNNSNSSRTPSSSPPIRKNFNEEFNRDLNIINLNNLENSSPIYSKIKISNNNKIKINQTNNNFSRNSVQNSLKSGGDELNSFIHAEENMGYANNCDKCYGTKDSIKKAINMIKNYVDCINDRLNIIYHKISPQKRSSINPNLEIDYTISPEFYHTLYYSEIDRIKLSSEISFQFRSLMKSIRLFNDKFEYMNKKHENFEKGAQECKNIKISNKTEDIKNLPEYDNDIKNLEVQKIFQNFNQAKESFENTLKDIKITLNSNDRNIIVKKKLN